MQYVVTTPAEMHQQLAIEGIEVIGSQIWIYEEYDGNAATEFKLTIAIPVTQIKGDVTRFKKLPTFKCACITHHGSWDTLKNAYTSLIESIMSSGNLMSTECREVYEVVVSPDAADNLTHIQMGIV